MNTIIRLNNYIVLLLGLYFGWLLSFPFYGPVLSSALENQEKIVSLGLLFAFFHAGSLILGGIFLKDIYLWKKLMLFGLTATVIINLLLLFNHSFLWFAGMIIFGISSAAFILGWSCIYTMVIPSNERIKKMAVVIIISNIIFVIINFASLILSAQFLMVLASIPLLAIFLILAKIPPSLKLEIKPDVKEEITLPIPLILIFCFFVAGLYLNGGFKYNILISSFEAGLPFFNNYKFIPYVIVLLIIYKFSDKIQYYLPVYMGVTFLGMSFVSFALLGEEIVGLALTLTLVEASFAFLDIFVWVVLGSLAFIYGAPYQLFGFVLGSMVLSILAGDLIGSQIIQVGETHRLFTAIFAAAAIFLAYTVMPWLNYKINKDFTEMTAAVAEKSSPKEEVDLFEAIQNQLLPGYNLTPREKEITKLILKGLKNKEVAEQLFISDNTLKSHLRNIYPKFGVTQKRELLSLALNVKKNSD